MSEFMMSMADYAKVCRKVHRLFVARKDDEAKSVLAASCKFPIDKDFLDKAVIVFHHQLAWDPRRGDPVCDWIYEARRRNDTDYPGHFVPLALAVLIPVSDEGEPDKTEEDLSTGIHTIHQTSTVVGMAIVADPVFACRSVHSVYQVHGVRSWPSFRPNRLPNSYEYERPEQIGGNGGTCYTRLTRNFSAKKDKPKVAAVLAVLRSMNLRMDKAPTRKDNPRLVKYVVYGGVGVWDETTHTRRYLDPNAPREDGPFVEDRYPPLEEVPISDNPNHERYYLELGRVMEQPWPLPKGGAEIDPESVERMSVQTVKDYTDKRNTTTFTPVAVLMDAARDRADEVGLKVKFTWSLHSPYIRTKEIRELRIAITMWED